MADVAAHPGLDKFTFAARLLLGRFFSSFTQQRGRAPSASVCPLSSPGIPLGNSRIRSIADGLPFLITFFEEEFCHASCSYPRRLPCRGRRRRCRVDWPEIAGPSSGCAADAKGIEFVSRSGQGG